MKATLKFVTWSIRRVRGDSLWQTARRLADMPQEPEYLQRATDSFKQAQQLYERVPGYPGVATNLRRTRRALEQIDERLALRATEREDIARAEPPWR